MNTITFVGPKNLTVAWKDQYEWLLFRMALKADADGVVIESQQLVLSGSSINISVAPAPPRGDQPEMQEKDAFMVPNRACRSQLRLHLLLVPP